jgi:hypothetical protein
LESKISKRNMINNCKKYIVSDLIFVALNLIKNHITSTR